MVHIGCGADIIRQRRRNEQLQREAQAQGTYVGVRDWKPAKNHKYPHYTPARDKVTFLCKQTHEPMPIIVNNLLES